MEKNKKKEELQSRREFFKKTAKGVLPILALTMLGSTVLSSCGDDDNEPSGCKSNCTGNCKDSCQGSCKWSCAGGSDRYD